MAVKEFVSKTIEEVRNIKGGYFDQLSLAAIGNLTAGMTSVNGSFLDLILSFIIIRIGLRIFYNIDLPRGAEIQLFIISIVSWIIGNALLKGHDWNTQEIYLDPSGLKTSKVEKEDFLTSRAKFAARVCLDFIRKII